MTDTHHVRTFCRLCEVGCGLTATVTDGLLDKVRPDHDHPVTKGYACNKGLRAVEVHHDPDRVRRPLRRSDDGGFEAVSWDSALADIGARLNELVERHGPRSVGVYLGNPNAFNSLGSAAAMMLGGAIRTDRVFSAMTQDCANKYAIAELLYGAMNANPIPDLDRTQMLIVIGSNARVSKSSFLSMPDPVARFRRVEECGGKVVFVDPLDVEPDLGESIQLKPDTDAYLLAAMLHEIHRTSGFRLGELDGRVIGIDDVIAFIAPYSPAAVADVVGVPAETISRLAREFAAADGASIHASTGLNMGRQGALAYWLVQMLLLLTGNLDRPGGSYFAARAIAPPPGRVDRSADSFENQSWGTYRRVVGMLPTAVLPDLIADPDEPLRALIVLAGNPALTAGGGVVLHEALSSLDLLVSIDLYRNATGELSHYVLPATDQFEREDVNVFVQGVQPEPFVQWTARVVEPVGEQREEWRIAGQLLQAMGHTPALDPSIEDPAPLFFDGALGTTGLSVAALRGAGGVVEIPDPGPGGSIGRRGIEGALECVPEALRSTLDRGHELFAELAAEAPGGFKMITRRTARSLNSWLQNLTPRQPDEPVNPLWMHPSDAARLGIGAGDRVRVSNRYGSIEADVRTDPRLRPSVVAMTHGYSSAPTPGMRVAASQPGVNVNALAPHGPGTFDPVSIMSHMTGIPVEVEPLAGATT